MQLMVQEISIFLLQGLGIEFETCALQHSRCPQYFKFTLIFGAKIQIFVYTSSIIDKLIAGLRLITDKQAAGQLPVSLRPRIARSRGGAGRVTGTVRAEATTIGRPATPQSSTTTKVERAEADRAQRARAGQRARRGTKTDIAKWRCSLLDKETNS